MDTCYNLRYEDEDKSIYYVEFLLIKGIHYEIFHVIIQKIHYICMPNCICYIAYTDTINNYFQKVTDKQIENYIWSKRLNNLADN